MRVKFLEELDYVRKHITACQHYNHVQQVAYSTYHSALTQICFTCNEIRTNMKEEDVT